MAIYKEALEKLNEMLEDWNMMAKTSGDEGEEWAERFEKNFYEFIEVFEIYFYTLTPIPKSIEAAEKLPEIIQIQNKLPVPLQLNFENELERMIDGETDQRFD